MIIFIADECGKTIPIPVEWIKGILRYHLAMSECSHGSLFQMIQRRYRIGQVTTRAIIKWIVDNGYVSRIFFPSHPLSYCFVTDHQYNDFLKEYCLRW